MSVEKNIKKIITAIRQAEKAFNRLPCSVSLLVVSKSQSIDQIKAAAAMEQNRFGENYVQEALVKINALRDYQLEWHFIGAIQTNKIRLIATHFDWVQSVSHLKIAQALHRSRPLGLAPLSVCIQVNISKEKSKSGVNLANLLGLAEAIKKLDRLRLRGLMAIPAYYEDFNSQKMLFDKMKEAQQKLIAKGLLLDVLSLGTTHDFSAAIAAGSTMVRIGMGIFGLREET